MIRRILLLTILGFLLPNITSAQATSPFFGTYLGKSGISSNSATAVNPVTGDYCTGGVTNDATMPTVNAFQAATGGGQDAWMACIETTGNPSTVRFWTYLGGSSSDVGTKMVADASGNLYITGFTASTNFPKTVGSACPSASNCAFVEEFSDTGSRIFGAVFNSGAGTFTHSNNIWLDGSGNIWLTGYEAASNVAAKQVWVAECDATCQGNGTLTHVSTALGGTADSVASAIAVSGSTVYVGGYTLVASGFATGGAWNTTCGQQCTETPPSGVCVNLPCGIGFAATYSTSALAIQAVTYVGGTTSAATPCWPLACTLNAGMDQEVVTALAVDSASPPHVYLTGTTSSSDYPTTGGAFQTANKGTAGTNSTTHAAGCLGTYSGGLNRPGLFACSDAFVTELNTALTTDVASTMIGSVGMDIAWGILIDGSGNIWVGGSSQSNGTTYGGTANQWPITSNALQQQGISGLQMFATEFSSNLQGPLLYSTLFGNGPDQWNYGIALTAAGFPVIGGYSSAAGTACQTPTLTGMATCTSTNTLQSVLTGIDNAFLAVIATSSNQAASPVCSPLGGNFGGPISVTCTDSSAGSNMCYRTDGTAPATNGAGGCAASNTAYTTAIPISATTTLQIIAGGSAYTDSPITTNVYTIGVVPAPPGFFAIVFAK